MGKLGSKFRAQTTDVDRFSSCLSIYFDRISNWRFQDSVHSKTCMFQSFSIYILCSFGGIFSADKHCLAVTNQHINHSASAKKTEPYFPCKDGSTTIFDGCLTTFSWGWALLGWHAESSHPRDLSALASGAGCFKSRIGWDWTSYIWWVVYLPLLKNDGVRQLG